MKIRRIEGGLWETVIKGGPGKYGLRFRETVKEERDGKMILLDYRDKRPIYEQVVEKLERLIVSGGLEPLTRMPSVRSLAMELSVNPNTIQRAYAQLEQDGYLYTVSGRGSFVTAESDWRENRQGRILQEWKNVTQQAREAGVPMERLKEELGRAYESG